MKRPGYWIVIAAVLATSGCGNSARQQPSQPVSAQPSEQESFVPAGAKGVRTITIEPQTIPEYLEIPGRVTPDPTRVVHVFPTTTGRILEMKVRPWDRVQQGQTLAVMESSDASRAMTDYQKARTDTDLKKKVLDRSTDLYAHHAIAEKDLQEAEADAESANSELKAALDHLHLIGVDPAGASNLLSVLAPRAGVVLDIGGASGELSKSVDSSQPLCTLADLDTVWVEGDIFEKDLNGLKRGAPAEITLSAYPDQKWEGHVDAIGDAVDPVTRTLQLRVQLSNPQLQLKPDMFATIRLLRNSTQGLLVPSTAIEREGDAAYVFVGTAGNRFERRKVSLGPTVGDNVEVTSGLTAGAIVVSDGAVLLRAASQE